jgi:hypothetical protein
MAINFSQKSIMKKLPIYLLPLWLLMACQSELPLPELDFRSITCSWDSLKGSLLLPVSDSCRSEPWPETPPIGYDSRMPDSTWYLLGANPEQLQQFMYVLRLNTLPIRKEIWLMDLCTGLKLRIMDDARPMSSARWSSHNWIVFEENHQLWKITTQGDSLTQLTNSASNAYGDWSPDGAYIYYRRQLTSRGAEARYAIMDQHGQFVSQFDSLQPYHGLVWSPDKSMGVVSRVGDSTVLIDFQTNELSQFVIPEGIGRKSGVRAWQSEQEIYLSGYDGIYFYHLMLQQVESFFDQTCFDYDFLQLTVSRDRKYGIVTRLNRSLYDPATFWDDTRLYWLDFDNEEMWEMDLR